MGVSTWNEPGYAAGGIWACLAVLLPFAGSALAQDRAAPPLRTQLNKIEAAGETWHTMKLGLSALDADGIAAKRLVVEVCPVPHRRILIKPLDCPGLSHPRSERVLLDDVPTCESAANSREECLTAVEATSKIDAALFYEVRLS